MTTIRLMRQEDLDAVRQVEGMAFGAWWRQLTGRSADRPPRRRANVLASWEKDPQGCFVAEEPAPSAVEGNGPSAVEGPVPSVAEGPAPSTVEGNGHIVGSVFSRTWGGVGWFGNLAVLPECQGRGIGQRLIAASLGYLRQDPQRVIGLETMPESPHNLGLYLRRGFQVRLLTLLLARPLDPSAVGGDRLPRWSSADAGTQERWLADLREATGQLVPRLDYAKEIVLTTRHRLGETLLLTDGARAVGLSTLLLVSAREGWGEELAGIQVLALHPAHTDEGAFRALLDASEALARAHGKRALAVSINARHAWALARLLEWGYRVRRAMVRMVVAGTDEGPSTDGHVHLSRWAG